MAYGLQPLYYGIWPVYYSLWPAYYGYGLRTVVFLGPACSSLCAMAYSLCAMAYGLRTMAYGLRPTAYGLRPMAYGLCFLIYDAVGAGGDDSVACAGKCPNSTAALPQPYGHTGP